MSVRGGNNKMFVSFFFLQNGRFFTATDTNSVQAYKFPEGMPDGLVTRFTAPVNHMVFTSDGKTMVAGSRLLLFISLMLRTTYNSGVGIIYF
jgi:chromosome transmission fidelity protein 4